MTPILEDEKVKEALKPLTKKVEWLSDVFWTQADVAAFLSTLTEKQAMAAKVAQLEVKIAVIYPNA